MPSLTRNIPNDSDLAKRIRGEIQRRVRYWQSGLTSKSKKWREAEEKVLAYIPEREVDAARRGSRENGLPQYTTIQIPYSYAVVMAAYTYLTSVFMGRDPIFQFNGRHGETQQQVQALEALIAYQVLQAQMQKYLHTWLYDSLKYGEGIVGLWWDERIDMVSTIQEQQQTDPMTGQPFGPKEKILQSMPVRTYAGNRIYNIQPQYFIWDVRYPMREFQAGEFCGERKKIGWNEIVRRQKQGYYTNIELISSGTGRDFTTGEEGSSVLERPETLANYRVNEMAGEFQGAAKHPLIVGIYQLCMDVIPNEWQLGQSDYPEKWVFTVTDDYSVLIGAQPLGALHCKFPYSVIPFEPEGYGLTSRGMPEILEPIQNTLDWLVNSHLYNVRAALNNKFVVDPSRIVMKDVLDPLPGGVIRLKPEAYSVAGATRDSLTQVPVQDVTRSHLQDMQMMFGIGERTGGVNDSIMGMLAPGGRKTATEVRTSTSLGINRLKTSAEFASSCGFDPLSSMMVQNTQQYYDMELKFRIAGNLLEDAGMGFMMVNPQTIAGAFDFVPVDGTLPIDRMAQVQLWEQLTQTGMQNEQIMMGYDWVRIFEWIAKLAGLKNITQFKVQVLPPGMGAPAGSIPMSPNGPQGGSKRANGSAPSAQSAPGYSGSPGALQGVA